MTVESMLRKELDKLEEIVDKSEKRLSKIPRGRLRVVEKQGKYEYYLKEDNYAINSEVLTADAPKSCTASDTVVAAATYKADGNGRYLRKDEMQTAEAIAQRDYDIQVLKRAKERKKEIERFLKRYESTSLRNIYGKMCGGRRKLIDENLDMFLISDDEYVKRWLATEYMTKGILDDGDNEQVIITEKGERVRSKSEKIIADKLYMLGIPYRYECPVMMKGQRENITVYPDFTILRMSDRREVYFEHFGLMDDAEYIGTVMRKLDTYERNGIYLGINLFFTHETSKAPLNTVALDMLLRKLFCE